MEFFFNQINKNKTYSENMRTKEEDVLLIKNLKNRDKYIDIYISTKNNINLNELEQLCDAVGWVKRPLRKVQIALENSFIVTYLFYKYQDQKHLIGFARATSDNSFNATIWDVVIHPEFQRQGLGKALMEELIKKLRSQDISTITLFADPEVLNFYKNLGLTIDPDGIKGMFWYPL
uniref:N-acetyltransferase domain-containing protein n=1 Tax=Spyridia filamentosa TaxID=196632 RepID=A0A1Z1MK13_SPYFI|nr:hypothetical protein [Spyridia filamentosa]ARW66101.1 hypothetical protein [Spyridia filamentosa]